MCGMCLPHCPTYQIYRNESESPRGRISVIQAYAQNRLKPDNTMLQHLDHCLGCMACEAMCPSKVAYGRLMDNAQAMLDGTRKAPSKSLATLLNQTRRAGGLNRFAQLLRWYKSSGLQKWGGRLLRLAGHGQAARANDIAGLAQTAQLKNFYPAANKATGDVALFTGCMGASFDGETLMNAVKILTRMGYNVHIPANQYCCGALHQHHGQPQQAQQLAQLNKSVFARLPISHILYTANGCGAQLAQNDMPVPVVNIVGFLLSTAQFSSIEFQPLRKSAWLHESCSGLNKLKLTGVTRAALQRIPQLEIIEAQGAAICCGAGSSHQLLFGELADELLQLKLHKLKEIQPDFLLSDNLGCSLHFKNNLKKIGIEIEVIHPITLLARQLC